VKSRTPHTILLVKRWIGAGLSGIYIRFEDQMNGEWLSGVADLGQRLPGSIPGEPIVVLHSFRVYLQARPQTTVY
jgi:hypothetical protein